MQRSVLYITYDGLEEPLGRSQVLPYVEGLARLGHRFELLSFEKPGVPLRHREPLGENIRWTALRYHKRPTVPATAFDMASGAAAGGVAALLRGIDLIHTRSYVPATMALPLATAGRIPLLFDMRGLWADERVDAGLWPRGGQLYGAAKAVERSLLAGCDAITVLTHAMQRYLRDEYPHRDRIRAPIHVIPTCTDLDYFRPDVAPDPQLEAELGDATVLLYLGSIGTWYMSPEMARFYLAFRRLVPRARFLVVSQQRPDEIAAILADAGAGHELIHRSASRQQVPSFARCADASLCFVRPWFSKIGSAPTKLGELLGCGLPVAANVVGDMADVLGAAGAGAVVDDMSDEGLLRAARALLACTRRPDIQREARAEAERWFRLDQAVAGYDALYQAMPRVHGHPCKAGDGRWPPP